MGVTRPTPPGARALISTARIRALARRRCVRLTPAKSEAIAGKLSIKGVGDWRKRWLAISFAYPDMQWPCRLRERRALSGGARGIHVIMIGVDIIINLLIKIKRCIYWHCVLLNKGVNMVYQRRVLIWS